MLNVAPEHDVSVLIEKTFGSIRTGAELVSIEDAFGRVSAEDVESSEDIPAFDRSAVDGFAVRASDTFGCSDNLPAMLSLKGEVLMGEEPSFSCKPGECAAVPTGGYMPSGSDAAVMVEYSESYCDGMIGVLKPAAPGQNIIYRGDDVKAGQTVISKGKTILPHDVGALAAIGRAKIEVYIKPVVGILSTGDELIPACEAPKPGQIRDVNSSLLAAAVSYAGGIAKLYGICRDDDAVLKNMLKTISQECDIVIISGGSSVGKKDATPRIIEELGALYVHGVAIKPGKPTIIGEINEKPVFGLPGHPVAAYFIFNIFVRKIIRSMLGQKYQVQETRSAKLLSAIPSNHGREECISVRLIHDGADLLAEPVTGKSGLIARLLNTDGYLRVPRDQEGYPKGETVQVLLY